MTVRIAGLWELGWNTPIKEVDLWEYPLRDFNVERFYMVPVSGIRSEAVTEREYLDDVLAECRQDGFDIVFVDERGETKLSQFTHPENVLYVFGKASQSALTFRDAEDVSVCIETPAQAALLWPHQAAVIVLYDRLVKSWPSH